MPTINLYQKPLYVKNFSPCLLQNRRFPIVFHGKPPIFFCPKQADDCLLCLFGSLRGAVKSLDGLRSLFPLLLQRLLEDHILHLSKTLVQISTNSSKMTLFGRRVVTINLVERWLIHPNPGPVMSPLCQFSHPFLHLFPDYLRSDI